MDAVRAVHLGPAAEGGRGIERFDPERVAHFFERAVVRVDPAEFRRGGLGAVNGEQQGNDDARIKPFLFRCNRHNQERKDNLKLA